MEVQHQKYSVNIGFIKSILKYHKNNKFILAIDPKLPYLKETLDTDGLPFPGSIINPGEPFYWYFCFI